MTDAKSVYDYLQKDATSTSSEKRMAIEGALLRETVRRPGAHAKWIDGMQNIAKVLTEEGAEKDTLKDFLRNRETSFVQTKANAQLKKKNKSENRSSTTRRRPKQQNYKLEDANRWLHDLEHSSSSAQQI